MNGLFDEYVWVVVSIVGGFLGLILFFGMLMSGGSPMSEALLGFLRGLM